MCTQKTILCYGDSNTYGYNPANGLRYPENIRWPGRLKALLGAGYTVIEEGCNGRTTVFADPDESWKCGRDYLRACLNSHKPVDLVVMMLGTNDLKKKFHAFAAEIAAGAETLVRIIREFTSVKQGFAADILLVAPPVIGEGITTSPFRESFEAGAVGRSRELAAKYAAVAEQNGCLFLDAAQIVQPSRIDSLHLDPDAHAALAEAVAGKIQKHFAV